MENQNNYCVILAGGKGRRLWPSSREALPKQFIDFFGEGRTPLQQTYDRFRRLLPADHIFVATNVAYADLVSKQLPEVSADNVLLEPVHRNTAPSTIWAAHRIARISPDAVVVVTPADHAIDREQAFLDDVAAGFRFVEKTGDVLVLGISPTRPEPGYGYLQMGQQLGENVYKVHTFAEKPERDFANMFLQSGEFLWNTGLFISKATVLEHACDSFLPEVLRRLRQENPNHTTAEENAFMHEHFPAYPNMSIDHCLLEVNTAATVMRCNFGWADMGTWHGIYEAMRKSPDDNVVINTEALIEDAHDNVIKLADGRVAVISGLEGFIVAEQGNVLLICKKEDSSALIRKYVGEMQMRKGEEYV